MILSPEEVTRLIEAAPNLLYRTLLMCCTPRACAGARWPT